MVFILVWEDQTLSLPNSFFAAFSISKDSGVRCSVMEILEPLRPRLAKKILFLISLLENFTREIRLLGFFLLLMGCETEMQLRICSLVHFRSGRLVLIFLPCTH